MCKLVVKDKHVNLRWGFPVVIKFYGKRVVSLAAPAPRPCPQSRVHVHLMLFSRLFSLFDTK